MLLQLFVSASKLNESDGQGTIACSNSMKWMVAYAAVQALEPFENLV